VTMRRPQPPFLELGFYMEPLPDAAALGLMARALRSMGVRFSGEAVVRHGGPSPDDVTLEDIAVGEREIVQRLESPTSTLFAVGAPGAAGGASDVLTRTGGWNAAPHNAIAIWTDDVVFDRPDAEAARFVRERFAQVVEAVRPMYAAITVEEGLPSPVRLRRDPRTRAFNDFYLSSELVARVGASRLADLYEHAHREPLAGGVYVSSTPALNSRGIAAKGDRWTASMALARAVGEAVR
jgi:hypothetical protein